MNCPKLSDVSIHHRRRTTRSKVSPARDGDNVSLVLRPAEFDDVPRNDHIASVAQDTIDFRENAPQQARLSTGYGPVRSFVKRRQLVELAGNPFIDPNVTGPDGQPAYRQDCYPAFDATGRRIGLDHVRNTNVVSESNGHYRKRVHEYDSTRGAPLPIPAQAPVQSGHFVQGSLPPVSAVIAGIPHDQYGVQSFSHIQNRPRTPHELLGLAPGVPLNLWSLSDPETPDAKPQYNYHVLVKLAILGNKNQKATLQDILRAIRLRFPYYANLSQSEATAFGNSIRHLLSLLAAFVREPKPVTEPGKGAYWRVDFSKGEGNKRVRKRNKPHKKDSVEQATNIQGMERNLDRQDAGSESEEPQAQSTTSGSGHSSSKSPASESPVETSQSAKSRNRGGRRPAPKNLITTPDGGTAVLPYPPPGTPQSNLYARLDPALAGSKPPASDSHVQHAAMSGPYLQLHPPGVGAHRERIARGTSRSAPYPPSVPRGSHSASSSSSSENSHRYSSVSPVDTPYGIEDGLKESPASGSLSLRHNQHGTYGSNGYHGIGYTYREPVYTQHRTGSNKSRIGSVSPQDSPMSAHPGLSPYSEPIARLPADTSHYSHNPRYPAPLRPPPPPSSASYGYQSLASPSSAGSGPGPCSAVSQTSSYYSPYSRHRPLADSVAVTSAAHAERSPSQQADESLETPITSAAVPHTRSPVD